MLLHSLILKSQLDYDWKHLLYICNLYIGLLLIVIII